MASVNKVILIGHLGRDPEVRYLNSGDAVVNFSLATTDTWKKDGVKQEKTVWHRCNAYGKLAEIIGEYVKKGQAIYVEGAITSDSYTDKKTGEEKTSYGVRVAAMQMLGGRNDQTPAEKQHLKEKANGYVPEAVEDEDDDLPF